MRIRGLSIFTIVGCLLLAVWCILAAVSPAAGRETIPVLLGAAIGCFVAGIIRSIVLFRNQR